MACEDTFTSALKNHFCTFGSQPGGMERYLATLTPEQALITEISHPGSLSKATRMVSLLYPSHDVITLFSKVPWEPLSPGSMMRKSPNVLVAFMFRYHEHVMRHGVYLKVSLPLRRALSHNAVFYVSKWYLTCQRHNLDTCNHIYLYKQPCTTVTIMNYQLTCCI